ncbi:hypothetical protein AB4Y44_13255 [Paraburkholderia sp. BR10937]|uniref:hypothetical protein n=1 Tax=Paraburkholderia sp. BR10937 TaxID=3236994 RepID=UPI0034D21AAE
MAANRQGMTGNAWRPPESQKKHAPAKRINVSPPARLAFIEGKRLRRVQRAAFHLQEFTRISQDSAPRRLNAGEGVSRQRWAQEERLTRGARTHAAPRQRD